jgi:uncharacterized membrane protein YhaH (DUF805 family)
MALIAPAASARANFLFRTDEGRIDARTWRVCTAGFCLVLLGLTAIWIVLAPNAHRDIGSSPFFSVATMAAYAYLLVYAFAILLIGICHYNLSAKRWRDRGKPAALAALLPLAVLFAGAAHWLQPRVAEDMSFGYVLACDLLLAAIIVWNIVELAALPAAPNAE